MTPLVLETANSISSSASVTIPNSNIFGPDLGARKWRSSWTRHLLHEKRAALALCLGSLHKISSATVMSRFQECVCSLDSGSFGGKFSAGMPGCLAGSQAYTCPGVEGTSGGVVLVTVPICVLLWVLYEGLASSGRFVQEPY